MCRADARCSGSTWPTASPACGTWTATSVGSARSSVTLRLGASPAPAWSCRAHTSQGSQCRFRTFSCARPRRPLPASTHWLDSASTSSRYTTACRQPRTSRWRVRRVVAGWYSPGTSFRRSPRSRRPTPGSAATPPRVAPPKPAPVRPPAPSVPSAPPPKLAAPPPPAAAHHVRPDHPGQGWALRGQLGGVGGLRHLSREATRRGRAPRRRPRRAGRRGTSAGPPARPRPAPRRPRRWRPAAAGGSGWPRGRGR